MRRFLDSLSVRTALVLVVGLVVSQILAIGIRDQNREQALAALEEVRIGERAATIFRMIEDAPLPDRPQLVKVLSWPVMLASWDQTSALDPMPAIDETVERLHGILSRGLSDRRPGDIRIAYSSTLSMYDPGDFELWSLWRARMDSAIGQRGGPQLKEVLEGIAAGPRFQISIQLRDSTWLNMAAPFVESLSFWTRETMLSMVFMALLVTVLAAWAVLRLTRPLGSFANAVVRLGTDIHTPPLPETGPREVRQASHAFNEMQQRIRRLIEDRTQMLAAISHDLRTVVTRLRLRGEFVEDPVHKSKLFADLNEMEAMISSTLSFARDDTRAEPVSTVDLVSLIQSVCDNTADMGFAVECEAEGRVPHRGRPIALRRCLANLIDNAVKYGGRAGVRMRVAPTTIAIDVDDDGPGIPAEEIDNVFRPFYRIETARTLDTGGVGLGLTLVRTIARAHGGDIELRNRPEGGLRATLTLPR